MRARIITYAFTAAGQVIRLAAGLLVFILLARILGPEEFGRFSLWLAIATMTAVLTNYGFNTYTLREIGAHKERSKEILAEVFAGKLVLCVPALFVAGIVYFFAEQKNALIFLFLFLAQLAESFSDFFNLFFRVNANYKAEGKNAVHVSLFHIVVFLCIALLLPKGSVECAAVFLISRVYGLLITLWTGSKELGWVAPASLSLAFSRIRSGKAYAFEIAINTFYSQFDAIVVNKLTGPVGLGLYQAGMKLVQGALRIAPILAQVVLPDLARAHVDRNGFGQVATRIFLLFVGIGISGAIFLTLARSEITLWLFGPSYVDLIDLLPLFGLVFLFRFAETGGGLVLVAMGQQNNKVWLVLIQLAILLSSGYFLSRLFGIAGWLVAISLSTFVILVTYAYLYRKAKNL